MSNEKQEKNIAKRKGKTLKGTVVSDKMDKTVSVLVDRYVKHAKYQKFMKKSKKYKAHDEENTYKTGDKVVIRETRPMSKDKSFVVVEKVNEGSVKKES